MKIVHTNQSTLAPSNKPEVISPVLVDMDVPVYYNTERSPVPVHHPIFCSDLFAGTVLKTLNEWCLKNECGFCHIGVYNPRMARHKDGTPIKPARWSNHSYGRAMDFKGIVNSEGVLTSIQQMAAKDLQEIQMLCEKAIVATGHTPEIVHEGSWLHIGIWPHQALR